MRAMLLSRWTRKQVGEGYSPIRGFFPYYELIYTIADERDVVLLRTDYRTGEEVYKELDGRGARLATLESLYARVW